MKYMKVISAILLTILVVVSFGVDTVSATNAESFGLITINGAQVYRTKHGDTYRTEVVNGQTYVHVSDFEMILAADLINCENGKTDRLLSTHLRQNATSTVVGLQMLAGQDAGYNQRYSGTGGWATEPLGFGPSNIGSAGCYLCSTAAELSDYGLTISGITVAPLNLNAWLKANGGFSKDDLIYSALASFPGIHTIYDAFQDFSNAGILISQGCPPIMKFTHPDGTGSHYCLYVQSTGSDPYQYSNGQYALISQAVGQLHAVVDSYRAIKPDSSDSKGYVTDLYQMSTLSGGNMVRSGVNLFRVALQN